MKFTKKSFQVGILFMATSLMIVLLISACCKCEEKPPIVFKTPDADEFDSSFVGTIKLPQLKSVLIEDFTGVRCPNCPTAHDEAKSIQNSNPGRVIVVSLHPAANSLTLPYTQIPGYLDLRLTEAQSIYDNLGGGSGLPAGAIDRFFFTGQTYRIVSNYNLWASMVTQRLTDSTPYNIEITKNYNAVDRTLNYELKIEVTSNRQDTVAITSVITENDIVNPQENPLREIDTFYIHNHVARKFLTSPSGKLLDKPLVSGRTFVFKRKLKLPDEIKADKAYIVAFVHEVSGNRKVFHVVEKSIQ